MPEKKKKGISERLLKEIKNRNSKSEIIDVEEIKIKLIIFTLNENNYAFHGSNVKEILHLKRIHYVPGCLNFIHGIIRNRRNNHLMLFLY